MAIASVVIPAHQEAATIGHCLDALLGDAIRGELQVVVAANGCTDGTAGVASAAAARLGHDVAVLDLPSTGKALAIREAERLALVAPHVFVDADVQCPTDTVRALAASLDAGADVAVPTRAFNLSGASRPARLYYRTWAELPWVRHQLTGRGVYALSAAARSTYDDLPDVVAEDRFATTRVSPDKAAVVAATVVIRPPPRLQSVVRVRRRVYRGNKAVPASAHDAGLRRRFAHLALMLSRPASWPGLLLFVSVTAAAKAPWPGGSGWGRDAARGGVV